MHRNIARKKISFSVRQLMYPMCMQMVHYIPKWVDLAVRSPPFDVSP